MSIKHLYEDERPALLLDFANSKTVDPRITFERQSIGTYVDEVGIIRTAADNEARINHDPETGECLGLLIEEERTNLALESEDWGNTTYWYSNGNKGGLNQANYQDYFIVTNNTTDTLSPDGANNAVKLTGDTTYTSSGYARGRVNIVTKSITLSQNTEYTFSVFVKDPNSVFDSNQLLYIMFGSIFSNTNAFAAFDLQNNTVSYGGDYTSSTPGSIKSYPNGWKKLTATFANTSAGGGIRLFINETNNFYGPNTFSTNGESFYAFGFQVEQSHFPSSYIPTSGSTYKRVPDLVTLSNNNFTNWYNNSEGTWVIDVDVFGSSSDYPRLLQTNLGHNFEYQTLNSSPVSASLAFQQWLVGQSTKTPYGIAPLGEFKVAANYSIGNFSPIYIDGTEQVRNIYYSPGSAVGTPPTELRIFRQNNGGQFLAGLVRSIRYFDTSLSTASLEVLTKF